MILERALSSGGLDTQGSWLRPGCCTGTASVELRSRFIRRISMVLPVPRVGYKHFK